MFRFAQRSNKGWKQSLNRLREQKKKLKEAKQQMDMMDEDSSDSHDFLYGDENPPTWKGSDTIVSSDEDADADADGEGEADDEYLPSEARGLFCTNPDPPSDDEV